MQAFSHTILICTYVLHVYTGDLVEKGVMRRLPEGFDGNTCPYIFTWSTERPNKTWGMGSGCSAYYNTVRSLMLIVLMLLLLFVVLAVLYLNSNHFEILASVESNVYLDLVAAKSAHHSPNICAHSLTHIFMAFANVKLDDQNKKGVANTRMERFFDEDRFEIYATREFLTVCLFDDARLPFIDRTRHCLTVLFYL